MYQNRNTRAIKTIGKKEYLLWKVENFECYFWRKGETKIELIID